MEGDSGIVNNDTVNDNFSAPENNIEAVVTNEPVPVDEVATTNEVAPTNEVVVEPVPVVEPTPVAEPNFETVSVSDLNKAPSKKKWGIIAAVIAVLVIAAVTVVVVVLNNNTNNNTTPEEPAGEITNGNINEEAMKVYKAASSEITKKILEDSKAGTDVSGKGVINLYLEKISETKNAIAKAMLLLDYYQTLMVYQPTLDIKDSIMNGLIDVDKILETGNSAMAVADAASYYGDTETAERYNQIANERMAEGNYGFHGGDEEVGE